MFYSTIIINNLLLFLYRKRYQSEQQRSPYSEPTSPYNIQKNYQQSSETTPRQQITTTIYHKPIRDYTNKNTTNTKTKSRIHLRKNRNQHNTTTTTTTSTQRNIKLTPDKSLRNNLQSSSPVVTQNILNTEPNKQCYNDINSNNNNTNNKNNINNNINNEINYLNTLQSLNKSSKKHQLKHVTREQDQARAMSQVVKWLETEFKQKEAATSGASGRHHVHEHIHHHYHHYAEPAIV